MIRCSLWHSLMTLCLTLITDSLYFYSDIFVNVTYLCGIRQVPIFLFLFSDCQVMCFECNVAVSSIQSAVSSLECTCFIVLNMINDDALITFSSPINQKIIYLKRNASFPQHYPLQSFNNWTRKGPFCLAVTGLITQHPPSVSLSSLAD